MSTAVTVSCADCEYVAAFRSLRRARTALDDHERTTGHAVEWEIERLASGVERAGADAGVCGRDDCANPDSPLLTGRQDDAADS